MTGYSFNDSSMDETFIPDKGEEAKWRVDLHMSFEHMNLTDEQLRKLHDVFVTALHDAEGILERDDE